MKNEIDDILDRLKSLISTLNISQAETAKQLGVAQKTLSFWLTGKTHPTAKKVRVIEDYCNKYDESKKAVTKSNKAELKSSRKGNNEAEKSNKESKSKKAKSNSEDLSGKILEGIILEAQSGKELDEGDKQNDERYREYYNGKVIALTLEDKNNSRMILFPSISGTEDEWYKMGGQSALFYKYIIGPRLKKKPAIRKDNDLRHRFKHGIIAVHWGERFIKDVTTIGLTAKRIDYGIIIVDMERSYSAKEIEEMRKCERETQEKVKKMIMPERNIPDLYGLMRQLAQILLPKVKKMDSVYREVFGKGMLEVLTKLVEVYFQMANGRTSVNMAREEMLEQVDNMTALLAIIDEGQLVDLITRTRIGEILIDMKMTIRRRLS